MGTLTVAVPGETKTLTWNGKPEDQQVAREEFERLVGRGTHFAYVVTDKGRSTQSAEQIRQFDPEVEDIVVTPRLVGG
jgi:hypothetical protein